MGVRCSGNFSLVCAMRKWLSSTARARRGIRNADWAFEHYIRYEMASTLKLHQPREAWIHWHTVCINRAQMRALIHRCLSHMLNSSLSKGWSTWVDMAVKRARSLGELQTVMRLFSTRSPLIRAGTDAVASGRAGTGAGAPQRADHDELE